MAAGWLEYPSGILLSNTAPHWIVAMWVLFASTLNVSLRWLRGRWALATLLGAVAGPLAYYGGAGLGACRHKRAVTSLHGAGRRLGGCLCPC